MVIEDLIINIPESLIGSVKVLIYIIQAAGILIIAYLIYFTIQTFLSKKRLNAIEKISKDVNEIKRILKRKK
jgi:threonine/homoserine/homoserine lactone efflux protein|tara:strand:- start:493 stop:708 length:216 start_codon:yes stop_codon:yes gene_type:complete